MALKDWEKRREGWWNSKKLQLLTLNKPQGVGDFWEVRLSSQNSRGIPLKFFKTKTQAIRFAMGYMRTH